MEHDLFDALTRILGTADSRRGTVRALGGAFFSSLLAPTLGVDEDAAAKARQHARGKKDRHDSNRVQSEGKRKGRGKKGKRQHKSPPLPPGCQDCNDCQKCQNGACVPDPDLDGIICQGSGAACGYCQSGQCAPSMIRPCSDGICPARENQCCSDEKLCIDRESSTGVACIPKDKCCPDTEQMCRGICITRAHCCQDDRPQNCGPCGAVCNPGGIWACSTAKVCANGTCGPVCPHGQELDTATCQCKVVCPGGQERCADDTCCDGQCTQYTCCPAGRDFCQGTCCIPGARCVINGRHGICCNADQSADCIVNGIWLGCYNPEIQVCAARGPEPK